MKKISISINGHSTSISIEEEFLEILDDIASKKKLSRNKLVTNIDKNINIKTLNLSSKIRIYILKQLMGKN